MTRDALAPFVRAYRDENPGTALDAGAIRRRVLGGFQLEQRRRLFTLRFVLPVAATFFGSVAFAAGQGALPRWQEVREWLGAQSSSPALKPAETPRPSRGVRRTEGAPSQQEEIEPPRIEPPVLPSANAPDAHLPADEVPAAPARPTAPRADPLRSDLAAYERAHRLHFHGGESSAALVAWDAYLASHGAGTFVPEARFNRAVCLLRLGRRAEAKQVLVAIAESGTAVHGRERARALLDAME